MIEKLIAIQAALKAPKNQRNTFGNYNYRSCEDILEAVKPLLAKQGLLLTLSDEIISIDGWKYVQATATITDGDRVFSVSAEAREEETKKGMDASQITGSASSYARKYALNGLFLIDDTKDADATNTHGKVEEKKEPKKEEPVCCENCGKEIAAYKSGTKMVYPAAHIKRSKEVFGKVLCIECIEKDAGTNS